jgi:hypothetical protein
MIGYHGLANVSRALSLGILAADDPSCGCYRPPHICFAERPELAANFGTVLRVDLSGLDVIWESGEGRLHEANVPPWRLSLLDYCPVPSWDGWEDPALRVNHIACRRPVTQSGTSVDSDQKDSETE